MNAEIKIIKLLLGNREKVLTIKKISELARINYRIAHEKVNQLGKEGIIAVKKAGNSRICELTDKFDEKIFEAEYERRRELFKKTSFLVIYNRLAELKFPFIALVFGSHVKGTANRHSDIDILAIGGDEKEILSAVSLLSYKIHITHVTYKDFISMAKSREFTVVSEAIKNKVILLGIEEYYRLLSNAQ